jgi:hypothetical protein
VTRLPVWPESLKLVESMAVMQHGSGLATLLPAAPFALSALDRGALAFQGVRSVGRLTTSSMRPLR